MSTRAIYDAMLIMVGLLLIDSSSTDARTWVVEKDGSGDFTVIQDAVNAASSGDVIEIGAGRFEEFQTIQNSGLFFDLHVLVPDGVSLTFRGIGSEGTIIGPENSGSHINRTCAIVAGYDVGITVRDIGFENCSMWGIGFQTGSLDVQNCRFSFEGQLSTDTVGVKGGFSQGAVINNCQFIGLFDGVSSVASVGGVEISNCEFIGCYEGVYAYTTNSGNVTVMDSHFECLIIGIVYLAGAGGDVQRCMFRNCTLTMESSGEVYVADCTITRNDGRTALRLMNHDPVTLERNVIESNGDVIYAHSFGLGIFRNNDFIRSGDGYWVRSDDNTTYYADLDLSGNYWGTTDVEEIAEGIHDCHDVDHAYHCVIFEPLADGSVPVEPHTWTEVKQMFRPSGR